MLKIPGKIYKVFALTKVLKCACGTNLLQHKQLITVSTKHPICTHRKSSNFAELTTFAHIYVVVIKLQILELSKLNASQ